MGNPLYTVGVNNPADAQDLNQVVDILTGGMDGSVIFYQPIANAGAPDASVSATAGVLNGAYAYLITFRTGNVDGLGTIYYSGNQTAAGAASTVINPANNEVDLSAIPIGPTGVVARDIYRTQAGGSTFYYLGTLTDNVTTEWTDNTPDSSLGTTTAPTVNTTGSPPQLPVYPSVPGYTAPEGSLAFVDNGTDLLLYQSTGSGWEVSAPPIPTASATAAGLVEIPQTVSGTPISPVRVGDTEEVTISTAATWTTVNPAFTPSADGFFDIALTFRLTANATVQAQVTYATAEGAATTPLLNSTAYTYTSGGDNTYNVLCAPIRAVSGTAVAVQIQSSVASAIIASANVIGR